MPARWISVAGSLAPQQPEFAVPDPNAIALAAEELGRELAKADCGIVVYSDNPRFADAAVVRGYMESKQAKPLSIRVMYPYSSPQPHFNGQENHLELFEFCPDQSDDWESSSYRALHTVDGILILGGGQYTYIAGLVAMGLALPVLALAAFGGAGAKIWRSLLARENGVTKQEIFLMGHREWQPDSAARSVQTLIAQQQRRKDEERRRQEEEYRRNKLTNFQAISAAVLFAVAVVIVPFTWENTALGYRLLMIALLVSPLLAGTSGATVRTIFDLRQSVFPKSPQDAITTASLGLVAGGVAGLLFILAQMTAIPPETGADVQLRQASRLIPFAMIIGFLAGFTLDAVFHKLQTVDVVRAEAIGRSGQAKP